MRRRRIMAVAFCVLCLGFLAVRPANAAVVTAQSGDTMYEWVTDKLGLFRDEPDPNRRNDKIMRAVYVIQQLNEAVRNSPDYKDDEIEAITNVNLIFTGKQYFLPGAGTIQSIVDSQDPSMSLSDFKNAVRDDIQAAVPQVTSQYTENLNGSTGGTGTGSGTGTGTGGAGDEFANGQIPSGGVKLMDEQQATEEKGASEVFGDSNVVNVAKVAAESTEDTLGLSTAPLTESPNIFVSVWNSVWGFLTGGGE